MKTKQIPAIVMLLGGAVACIVTYINHYDLKDMLTVVIVALLIFLIMGIAIKMILDSFKLPEEDKVDDEGEVVEKQLEPSEGEDIDMESVHESEDDDSDTES